MAENKTKPTDQSVDQFLDQVSPAQKQEDCKQLRQIIEEVSGEPAVMWGNMIGAGKYHYKYDSGHEGDMFLIGFAPRAKNISIYGAAYNDELDELKKELGKVKLGKSCIYVNTLADIDQDKLKEVFRQSIDLTLKRYPQN
jgi:hypothetical protein